MKIKSAFTQNFYMDPEEVRNAGNRISTVMTGVNGCIEGARGLISQIASLAAEVPAEAKCGALISACDHASMEMAKSDFAEYGILVNNSMMGLADHSEAVMNETIGKMGGLMARYGGVRNTAAGLRNLISFKAYKNNKNMSFEELRNIYKQHEKGSDDEEIELTDSYIAAKLAGVPIVNGRPNINGAYDARRYSQCLSDLKAGNYENSYIAAKLAGVRVSDSGNIYINGEADAKSYNYYLNRMRKLHIAGNRPIPDTPLYNYTQDMIREITYIDPSLDQKIQDFQEAYERNKPRYIALSEKTGVPPEVIAVIHYRENTPDYLNGGFNVYLHNGQQLGVATTLNPPGKLFNDFDEAAIDAIESKGDFIDKYYLTPDSDDIVGMMCFIEVYNGTGYFDYGHISPYSYSGTNLYESGKYIEEGGVAVYHSEIVDDQIGSYVLLNAIMEE